jgi:hypothetical protein
MVLAVCAAAGLALSRSAAQDDKEPSIKQIMTKAHKGGNSLLMKIGKELKGGDVDWSQVREQSKDLVKLGKALTKNEPPKGEKASWETLTKLYQKNATTLDEAVDKKDKDAAVAAHGKLAGSCKACHTAHKG